MVFYRKYRPQTISDLDLPSVREKLSAILSSKDLPHAFLFTGSKGLGKTSAARILAKAINCTKRKENDTEPCNKCDACKSITNGSNIDILEIDAASNGGVEEIRTLRERVKFAPSALKYKVYIIDEVHMLSTGAFNALLKTLEEPPSHVIFILATTELWKLPATVVSRTFQVLFEKPTSDDMVRSLTRIVKGENLQVDKRVLSELGKISEGSFRDGAKLLEEMVLNSHGKDITYELFENTFKTKGIGGNITDLLKAYGKKDAKEALLIISRLSLSGSDFKVVIERLVDHLRGLLMLRNGIESEDMDVPELNIGDIKELLELANEAYGELRVSVIPQLPLELMSVKFCILDKEEETKDRRQETGVSRQETEDRRQEAEDREVVINPAEETIREPVNPMSSSSKKDKILPQLILKLNEVNKPGAALLRSCKDAIFDGSELTIVTPFPIHAERLKSEKVLPDLQKVADEIFDEKVEIHIKILPNLK